MADIKIEPYGPDDPIIFTVTDGDVTFTDALVPASLYGDKDQIAAEIQRRYNNWITPVYPDNSTIEVTDVVNVLGDG